MGVLSKNKNNPKSGEIDILTYDYTRNPPVQNRMYSTNKISSRLPTVSEDPYTDSAFVNRRPRREGLRYGRAWGSVTRALTLPNPGNESGAVRSSEFQRNSIHLYNAQFNDKWYICFPRNLGLSERVPQLATRTSGGPGPYPMHMQPRQQYTKVQNIFRYSAAPGYYDTDPRNN